MKKPKGTQEFDSIIAHSIERWLHRFYRDDKMHPLRIESEASYCATRPAGVFTPQAIADAIEFSRRRGWELMQLYQAGRHLDEEWIVDTYPLR